MSNELIVSDMQELERMGAVFVKSKFFADTTDAAQAIVKIMAGRELGIAPIASMTGIHIIKGKPALGANIIATKIKASGKYNYRVKQNTPTICEIEFFERSGDKWESIGVSSFTIEDARKASTQNLDKFPRNMLFARAMSNGAKWYCPDAFAGIAAYVPEEMGADVNDDGDIIDAASQPTAKVFVDENGEVILPKNDAPKLPAEAEALMSAATSGKVSIPSVQGNGNARKHPPISPTQRAKLQELYLAQFGDVTEGELAAGLNDLFQAAFKVDMKDANYEQGARMIAQLWQKQPA